MAGADLGPIVDVRLLDFPVQLWAQSQQHTDELFREFVLIAQQLHREGMSAASAASPPIRLVQLVEELSGSYGAFSEDQETRLFEAAAAGEAAIDLTYRVPAAVGPAATHLRDLLNEADDYCRNGDLLLTLETPAPLVAFREWFLEQFRRQAAGEPPTP